jgi:hypothetical protein
VLHERLYVLLEPYNRYLSVDYLDVGRQNQSAVVIEFANYWNWLGEHLRTPTCPFQWCSQTEWIISGRRKEPREPGPASTLFTIDVGWATDRGDH